LLLSLIKGANFFSELPAEFYYIESEEAASSEGLLDVKLVYNIENLEASSSTSVNFGCALKFPPPLDMSILESLMISLDIEGHSILKGFVTHNKITFFLSSQARDLVRVIVYFAMNHPDPDN